MYLKMYCGHTHTATENKNICLLQACADACVRWDLENWSGRFTQPSKVNGNNKRHVQTLGHLNVNGDGGDTKMVSANSVGYILVGESTPAGPRPPTMAMVSGRRNSKADPKITLSQIFRSPPLSSPLASGSPTQYTTKPVAISDTTCFKIALALHTDYYTSTLTRIKTCYLACH